MILDPLKPYLRAIEAAAVALLLAGIWFGIWHYGNTRYDAGKSEVHKAWDADRAQWQSALDRQKTDAAMLLSTTIAQNDALRRANQALHDQQEKDYANHRAETDSLHAQLSHVGLRYAVPSATARCGQSGGGTVPGAASKASSAASTIVQLPDPIANDLWSLVYDADKLRDAYARCVSAVNGGAAL